MSQPESAPQKMDGSTAVVLGVIGVIFAIGPGLLMTWAAFFANVGPRTAAMVYTLPILLSTLLAIMLAVLLVRRGQRRWGMTVGWIALVVGVISYVVWAIVVVVGFQSGDGPF